MSVSQIVKSDGRTINCGDLLVEGFRESVRMDRLSTLLAEDVVVVLVRGLKSESLFDLLFSVALEHHQSSFVECNNAANSPGLGRCEFELISDELSKDFDAGQARDAL